MTDASGEPRSVWARVWRHPAVRWAERLFWAGVAVFVLIRIGPQLSAWTGIGPVMGQAPAFALETLDGDVVDSESLRGRVVVLNFWATWCIPCRVEIPALQSVWEDFGPDEVVVIGVSTDVLDAPVAAYLAERGVTYPVAMQTGEIRRAFGGISAIPTTFVIDAEGVVRHRVLGIFAPPAMRAAVRRALEDAGTLGDGEPIT